MFLKTIAELIDYVDGMDIKSGEELMILVGDKSASQVEQVREYLNTKGITFFGGIYAALLVKQKSERTGFIIQRHKPIFSCMVLPYLMRCKISLENMQGATAIVLGDGLSSKMTELTDTVYNKLGNKVTYIGGGAGFYDLQHRPCIFNNQGIYVDVLHICIVGEQVELAVEHGWNKLQGPFTVTASSGNILATLNGDNAFDVYRDVIEDVIDLRLSVEGFFMYAKDYPFGIIQKNDKDILVRDPICVNENNEIVCVASIPQGSKVYILYGNTDTLLESSARITNHCVGKVHSEYIPLLFDCISRAMFLEDKFDKELSNIQMRLEYMVEGALSIGEYASDEQGEFIIHNKSTILGLLPVKPA